MIECRYNDKDAPVYYHVSTECNKLRETFGTTWYTLILYAINNLCRLIKIKLLVKHDRCCNWNLSFPNITRKYFQPTNVGLVGGFNNGGHVSVLSLISHHVRYLLMSLSDKEFSVWHKNPVSCKRYHTIKIGYKLVSKV